MSSHDLGKNEKRILGFLFEKLHERVWKRKVADALSINPSSVNYWLEELKIRGLINPVEKDRRSPIELTTSGIIASGRAYESSQRENEYVCKLLDSGAEIVTSSPRTAILLGAYSIAELPIEDEPSAIGIAVGSRTYVGFEKDRTTNPRGRLYYKTHGGWNDNPIIAWKRHAHIRLEKYYNLVQTSVLPVEGEESEKIEGSKHSRPLVKSPMEGFPSVVVATDHPPHVSLSIAGAAMPAFVLGFLILLQSEDNLNHDYITTNAGELSWDEKMRVAEIAVTLEKNWRKRKDPDMLCSGIRPYLSALGGAACITKRTRRLLPRSKTMETKHPSDLYHERLDLPERNLPLMLLEFDGVAHEPSELVIKRVLKKKLDLDDVLPENSVFHDIYHAMNNMAKNGKGCFRKGEFNYEGLGRLMTLQHELLRLIGASYNLADRVLLRFKSKCSSVLGGKVTSAGGKGAPLSILYDPDREPKEVEVEMGRAIKPSQGHFNVLMQNVNYEEGVRIHIPPNRHWKRIKRVAAQVMG